MLVMSIYSDLVVVYPQIRSGIDLSSSEYDKEKLQERLAKLSGGVAVLKVWFLLSETISVPGKTIMLSSQFLLFFYFFIFLGSNK